MIELEALESKLAITKSGDEEESKEKGLINKRIQSLQHSLAQIVAKVMAHVKKQLESVLKSQQSKRAKLQDIQTFVTIKRSIWKQKTKWTAQESFEARQDIQQLSNQIEQINHAVVSIDPLKVIQFEESELYSVLQNAIKINSVKVQEKYLMTKTSLFDINTGEEKKVTFTKKCPRGCATFQVNQNLYVVGGSNRSKEKILNLNKFFCFNYSGMDTTLANNPHGRSNLTLCGVPELLVSIGGYNGKPLVNSERYDIKQNRWHQLPSLNKPRQYAAACVSEARKVFCFFGCQNLHSNRTSIQTFDLKRDSQWGIIELPSDITAILESQLAAVPISGFFMLFGNKNLYYFSDKGELIGTDQNSKIPCGMRFGFYISQNDSIYSVGETKTGIYTKMVTYNGKAWKQLG